MLSLVNSCLPRDIREDHDDLNAQSAERKTHMIRRLLLSLAVAMVPLVSAAHSKSEAMVPAQGATVSEVPELYMRFDDPMRIISVTLSSAGGDVELERATGMEPTKEFRAMPAEALAPGSYRFDWRGMASDGHPMQGSVTFTVVD